MQTSDRTPRRFTRAPLERHPFALGPAGGMAAAAYSMPHGIGAGARARRLPLAGRRTPRFSLPHRRHRHARRRLQLLRHRRSQDRCQRGAHAQPAAPGGTRQRPRRFGCGCCCKRWRAPARCCCRRLRRWWCSLPCRWWRSIRSCSKYGRSRRGSRSARAAPRAAAGRSSRAGSGVSAATGCRCSLRELGDVQMVEERFVRDGNVWTAAGVSASIDLMLALIAETAGPQIAGQVQFGVEYYPAATRYSDVRNNPNAPRYLRRGYERSGSRHASVASAGGKASLQSLSSPSMSSAALRPTFHLCFR